MAMELSNYQGSEWQIVQMMNEPLVIQSVIDWMRANFITAQVPFINVDYLLQWTVQDMTLLYALMLQALPVTQTPSLKANVLMGHIKQAYFSGVVAIQGIYTKLRCPYQITSAQKKAYVVSPLVQVLQILARESKMLSLWRHMPTELAPQMMMRITPTTIETIREMNQWTIGANKGLVDIDRLIQSCEKKYVVLFNSNLKNVWVETAAAARKNAQTIGLRVNDPQLWVVALWYLENSARFHKLMREITPDRTKDKVEGLKDAIRASKVAGAPVLSKTNPILTEKQMAQFENEMTHSLFAAYATYERGFILSENFYEQVATMLPQPLELPTPRVTKEARSANIYTHVLWTMPPEVDYIKDKFEPKKLTDHEVEEGDEE